MEITTCVHTNPKKKTASAAAFMLFVLLSVV
jgi:hypothetical protein